MPDNNKTLLRSCSEICTGSVVFELGTGIDGGFWVMIFMIV
jgi:hypothetical protein